MLGQIGYTASGLIILVAGIPKLLACHVVSLSTQKSLKYF